MNATLRNTVAACCLIASNTSAAHVTINVDGILNTDQHPILNLSAGQRVRLSYPIDLASQPESESTLLDGGFYVEYSLPAFAVDLQGLFKQTNQNAGPALLSYLNVFGYKGYSFAGSLEPFFADGHPVPTINGGGNIFDVFFIGTVNFNMKLHATPDPRDLALDSLPFEPSHVASATLSIDFLNGSPGPTYARTVRVDFNVVSVHVVPEPPRIVLIVVALAWAWGCNSLRSPSLQGGGPNC